MILTGSGTQRDVVVGRRTALFRTVLRRRLRVHVEDAGENVGKQLARRDRPVTANRMETYAEGRIRQQPGIVAGVERHQFGFGVGLLEPRLQFGDARRRILREELRTEINQWRALALVHIVERGDQVARLQVVAAEAEDRGGQAWHRLDRRNAGVAHCCSEFS